jgi:hypothetical protein
MTFGLHYNRMPKKQLSVGFPVSYDKPNKEHLTQQKIDKIYAATSGA